MHSAAVVETTTVRVFTRIPNAEKVPTTVPSRGYNARMHRHRWHRNAKLSPGQTFAHARYFGPPTEPDLQIAIWELPLQKFRQHQDHRPPAPRIQMTKEQGHHHRAASRKDACAIHLPGPLPRRP
jgi:hypothetical protein